MILASLGRNLLAGARLALFLPLRPFDYRVSALDYAALVLFNALLWIAVSAVRAGFDGSFEPRALLVYAASVPLILATAMVVAHVFGMPERLLLLAVAFTASDAAFELAGIFVPYLAAFIGLAAIVAFFVWIWAAMVRAVRVCAGRRRPELYQAVLAVSVMMAVAIFVFPRIEVWDVSPQAEEEVAPLADERLFHLQGELIARSLAAIEPGRAGVRELYFVGFAPDASQDVFVREMRFVKRLLEERLGAAGRSIVLANSYDALEEFPLATLTNLKRALERVGAAMNDEDVLFLFLSAHGDEAHRLSAWQPPLELAPLTPTALARLLQDAGIKWKVVVVSACYSGGYIEPLRDANTIVISASASDRTSFGCESGRDFTYFGEAFFREALSRTDSFVEAFEAARARVAQREADEGLTASQPQMAVGASVARHLQAR